MDVPRRSTNVTAKVDANVEDLLHILISQNFVPAIDDSNIFIGIIKRRDVISYAYDKIKSDEGYMADRCKLLYMLGLSIRIIRDLDHEKLDMDRVEPPAIWWFFIYA